MKAALCRVEADDATLVARARQGDDAAFTELYRRHARYVAGVVYRVLGSDAALEDIVQESFVDASLALDRLQQPEHFRRWLVTVAVRRTRRFIGRQLRWRERLGLARPLLTPQPSESPEGRALLYQALDRVPEQLRVPWVLARVEAYTLPEVAEICDCSLATVKRRVQDAEGRLRRMLPDG